MEVDFQRGLVCFCHDWLHLSLYSKYQVLISNLRGWCFFFSRSPDFMEFANEDDEKRKNLLVSPTYSPPSLYFLMSCLTYSNHILPLSKSHNLWNRQWLNKGWLRWMDIALKNTGGWQDDWRCGSTGWSFSHVLSNVPSLDRIYLDLGVKIKQQSNDGGMMIWQSVSFHPTLGTLPIFPD